MISMQLHVFGNTRSPGESADLSRLVYTQLGHVSISGPLAAGYRDQSGPFDLELMIPRQSGRCVFPIGSDQRTNSREDALHIFPAGAALKVLPRGFQNEPNLRLESVRF